jgi:hypothetical protein
MLGRPVARADHETTPLGGGTVGQVRLVTGMATTVDGESLPFRLVWKTQPRLERPHDPGSWRREYDLYASDLGQHFTPGFRWPTCYRATIDEAAGVVEMWLEHVDGRSAEHLSGDVYERAAEELGRFQGRLYAERPTSLTRLANLSGVEFVRASYTRYRSWPVVHDYIRSEHCEIPRHLCDMLIELDDDADAVFERLGRLPVVLCHRDFWVANIIASGEEIVAIDWDTTGWGYLGEDIASLVADEADVEHLADYAERCLTAYYRGFSEHADISQVTDPCIRELTLILFGYRLVEWYLDADSPEEKNLQVATLEAISRL